MQTSDKQSKSPLKELKETKIPALPTPRVQKLTLIGHVTAQAMRSGAAEARAEMGLTRPLHWPGAWSLPVSKMAAHGISPHILFHFRSAAVFARLQHGDNGISPCLKKPRGPALCQDPTWRQFPTHPSPLPACRSFCQAPRWRPWHPRTVCSSDGPVSARFQHGDPNQAAASPGASPGAPPSGHGPIPPPGGWHSPRHGGASTLADGAVAARGPRPPGPATRLALGGADSPPA